MARSSRRLPVKFQPCPAPEDAINVLDCMLIHPQSLGELNAGQYSVDNPPTGLRVDWHATHADGVTSDPIQRGSPSGFSQIYEVSNFTDSPVIAYVWRSA